MKKIRTFAMALSIALFAWMGLSWIDIVNDNDFMNPDHSPYNFFVVLFE